MLLRVITSLAPFVVLVTTVPTSPIIVCDSSISLPLVRYINATGAAGDLVRRDRERARNFLKQSITLTSELTSSVEVTNVGNFYTSSVGVGIPPTSCRSCSFVPSVSPTPLFPLFQTISSSTRAAPSPGSEHKRPMLAQTPA
jgi:hypothetical protein